MKILLIIPAYNEQDSIGSLLAELRLYPEYDCLVVNDCSKDKTLDVVRQYDVKYLDLPINLGLSGAVQAGMLYAYKNNYDICVQIDGDGQHPPSEIKKLLTLLIEKDIDIAIGSRFFDKQESKYQQTFLRALGAKHISFCIKLLSGLNLTDPTSGMRAYKRKVFKEMAMATNERPEPDTILFFARRGFKIEETQVDMKDREAGESYLTPIRAVKYMLDNTVSFLFVLVRTLKLK